MGEGDGSGNRVLSRSGVAFKAIVQSVCEKGGKKGKKRPQKTNPLLAHSMLKPLVVAITIALLPAAFSFLPQPVVRRSVVGRFQSPPKSRASKASDALFAMTSSSSPPPPPPPPPPLPQLPSIPFPISVIGKSTRLLTSSSVLAYVLTARSPTAVSFLILSILTALLGKVLKQFFAEARPSNSPITDDGDHGMPSTHATALTFIASSSLHLLSQSSQSSHPTLLPLLPIAAPALGLYITTSLYYRKLRGLHTYPQLLAGAAVGTSSSFLNYKYTSSAASLAAAVSSLFQRLGFGRGEVPRSAVVVMAAVGGAVICFREIKQLKRFVGSTGKKGGGKEE